MATNSASAQARGSLLDRLLMSPRAQRRLTWLSACVLLAGVTAFLLAFVFDNHTTPVTRPSGKPGPAAAPIPKHVKPSKDAFAVARRFLVDGVARKDLHEAWTLVALPLKVGHSRKEWESGYNQIIPYPVVNVRTTVLHPITSTKNHLYLAMELDASAKSNLNTYTFYMGLRKARDGKWLVDYFEAENPLGVPDTLH